MATHPADFVSRGHIAHADPAACPGECLAFGGKGDGLHWLSRLLAASTAFTLLGHRVKGSVVIPAKFRTGGRIPEPDRTILASGDNNLAIRPIAAPGHASHREASSVQIFRIKASLRMMVRVEQSIMEAISALE